MTDDGWFRLADSDAARANFAVADERLARLFARNDGSIRTEEFSAFVDAIQTPHLGVRLTVRGSALGLLLRFAGALLSDPARVERYTALKLAHQNKPVALYRAAEDAFIAGVLNMHSPVPQGNEGP